MSLRRRLTLITVFLLIVGLSVADIVSYTSVRSSLYGRLDAQLDFSQRLAYNYLVFSAKARRVPTPRGLSAHVGPDVYVMVLNAQGSTVIARPAGSLVEPAPAPIVPKGVRIESLPRSDTFSRHMGPYRPNPDGFNASGKGSPHYIYRADAVAVPQGTLITAISLNPTLDTLESLFRVELLSSLSAVVAVCLLALWFVRRGLRPLEEMADAASGIAEGDFSRRVSEHGERSEVERLGRSFNQMVSQIEVAFAEKSESESRLRQFIGDASHELRTPLTSIRGYAELLRQGAFAEQDDIDSALGRIESEAIRMGGLVDDLLLLARLDQGRPLENRPVDLCEVAIEVISDAQAVEPTRNLNFVQNGSVVVAGDLDRLRQLVHNLVRNALEHTPSNSRIDVDVFRTETDAVIRVCDTGPGISPEVCLHVFDRFYRADPSRARGGSGLGLSIVQAIAEAFGGTATVKSAVGKGTTFTVMIPCGQD